MSDSKILISFAADQPVVTKQSEPSPISVTAVEPTSTQGEPEVVPEPTAPEPVTTSATAPVVEPTSPPAPPTTSGAPAPAASTWGSTIFHVILYLGAIAALLTIVGQLYFSMPHPLTLFKSEPHRAVTDLTTEYKILEVGKYLLTIQMPDGKIEKRTGGTRSWRLYNPGRLHYGKFTKDNGAVGSDGTYAVFPSYELGRSANQKLLFEDPRAGYLNLSIRQAVDKYAPESDGGRPAEYAKLVAKAAGVPTTTKMNQLTAEQQKKFLDMIEILEPYVKGYVWKYDSLEQLKQQG